MSKTVKIKCEPIRLTQFIKQSLAYGKSAISDTSLIKFTKEGAEISCALSSDAIIMAKYNKSYFMELEVKDGEEMFMSAATLVKDRLSHGFKGEKLVFKTDEEFVHIIGEGTDDKVKEKIEEVNPEKIATVNGKPVHTKLTQIGLLPYSDPTEAELVPFDLQALVATDNFSDLPEYEHIQFVFDGQKLTAVFADQMGERKRPIPFKGWAIKNKVVEGLDTGEPKGTPITITFNFKLLQQLISQFENEVWLSMNSGMLIFSNTNKDYSLSYMGALIV